MISVICVYNNERTLKEVLLKGLEKQTVPYELIALDNRYRRYRSAAEAYNMGGKNAKGEYIMFVHQDMWLGSVTWLEDVEKMLESLTDLGVAGVAGMSEKGRNDAERSRWSHQDFGDLWQRGKPVTKAEQVQTLDECLLLVPSPVFSRLKFDEETFDGWDCYGADFCLSAEQSGLRNYVIPAPSSHCCLRATYQLWEFKDLLKFHKRLYKKYKGHCEHIYLWAGEISQILLFRRSLMVFVGPLYLRIFPNFYSTLRKELSGCKSVLDLGCGYMSPIHRCDIPFSVGVELFEPYLFESCRKGVHNQYIRADLRRIEFKPKSFDAVIAIEVLEHLTKDEGTELLNKMEQWARRKVIISTPNGYNWQDGYDDNLLQLHKSDWKTKELRELGFTVFGISGWKKLRGYKGVLKHKPAFLWARISDITQKIAYRCPYLAFQLLAIKHIKEANIK